MEIKKESAMSMPEFEITKISESSMKFEANSEMNYVNLQWKNF